MPNAQCPMPNAQCPMPNAQCVKASESNAMIGGNVFRGTPQVTTLKIKLFTARCVLLAALAKHNSCDYLVENAFDPVILQPFPQIPCIGTFDRRTGARWMTRFR